MKFTQGDFRRFCAIFYMMSRDLLKKTEFLMKRENKKRMMPRHIFTAAVLLGIVPFHLIPQEEVKPEEIRRLEDLMNSEKKQRPPAKPRA